MDDVGGNYIAVTALWPNRITRECLSSVRGAAIIATLSPALSIIVCIKGLPGTL